MLKLNIVLIEVLHIHLRVSLRRCDLPPIICVLEVRKQLLHWLELS
jgi:hypothetical protein